MCMMKVGGGSGCGSCENIPAMSRKRDEARVRRGNQRENRGSKYSLTRSEQFPVSLPVCRSRLLLHQPTKDVEDSRGWLGACFLNKSHYLPTLPPNNNLTNTPALSSLNDWTNRADESFISLLSFADMVCINFFFPFSFLFRSRSPSNSPNISATLSLVLLVRFASYLPCLALSPRKTCMCTFVVEGFPDTPLGNFTNKSKARHSSRS